MARRTMRRVTASEAGYSGELAEVTNLLVESEDLQSCLQRVADLAVRAVPVCQGVGVVVADSAGARTLAATGDHVWAMAAYQYAENEGPGVEAIRYGEPRRIDDMVVETRWPGFSVMAAEQGLRSTLALPLRMAGPASGALTWYAQTPHAFDGASHDLAVLFALRGGLALSNSDPYFASQRLIQNLHEALATRAVIEQAKGVLMAREECTPDQAFDIMVSVSQRTDRKVREVAARVVADATGTSTSAG